MKLIASFLAGMAAATVLLASMKPKATIPHEAHHIVAGTDPWLVTENGVLYMVDPMTGRKLKAKIVGADQPKDKP